MCVNETELQYNYLLGLLCSILCLCLFLGCPETTDIFQYLTAKNVISYNPVLKDTEKLKGTTVFVIISKQLHYATNIHFNTDNQSSGNLKVEEIKVVTTSVSICCTDCINVTKMMVL